MQTPALQVSVPGQSESAAQPTHWPETGSQNGKDGNVRAHERPASPSHRGMQTPLGLSANTPGDQFPLPRRSQMSPAGHTEESAQPQVPRIPESGGPAFRHEGAIVAARLLAQSASLAQPQTSLLPHCKEPGQVGRQPLVHSPELVLSHEAKPVLWQKASLQTGTTPSEVPSGL